MKNNWRWYGNAGHLCVSNSCRFHLCTEVGKYLISTVGEYYREFDDKEMSTIGWDKQYYETEVFEWGGRCPCGCGLPEIIPSYLEQVRYETPKEANEGHLELCLKYDSLTENVIDNE